MKEETFRLWIVILLAVFVVGLLGIGLRFSENGRYVQFAPSVGISDNSSCETMLLDTRTGQVKARY
jgi:hypothetical protein